MKTKKEIKGQALQTMTTSHLHSTGFTPLYMPITVGTFIWLNSQKVHHNQVLPLLRRNYILFILIARKVKKEIIRG